jgi:hypothetical protein
LSRGFITISCYFFGFFGTRYCVPSARKRINKKWWKRIVLFAYLIVIKRPQGWLTLGAFSFVQRKNIAPIKFAS